MRASSLIGILLDLIEDLAPPGPLPAKARIGRFFRARRYLGSRDRRQISTMAFAWLRHRLRGEARWDAWALRAALPPIRELGGREAPLASLLALARDGLLPWSISRLLETARLYLAEPTPVWASLLERAAEPDALDSRDWPAEPLARLSAELSLPGWMLERLIDERGREVAEKLGALLLEEAPVDLRVNLSRTDRAEVAAALESALGPGRVRETPGSPMGLRLSTRKDLGWFKKAHPGWIEVQDEGSQLVALAAHPGPEEVIIDGCAGAGGKTLAFLDLRNSRKGRGEIHACDVNSKKLEELRDRAAHLGERGLAVHCIAPRGSLPAGLPGRADLVLVDAPCSGSGTLRRNPELKYRYLPEDITRFSGLQGSILRRYAPLVGPGGRLVYTTCSLFREENDEVVESFLKEQPEFSEAPPEWASALLPPAARSGRRFRLDPLSTGTDGFFIAILLRKV